MKADVWVGGGTSAQCYRHPLVSCITDFLNRLGDLSDPGVACRVWWTPLRAGLAAILMVLDRDGSLQVRFENARACMATDFATGPRAGGTYNGLIKALERQADTVLPILKRDLRTQAGHRLLRCRTRSKWVLLAVDGSKTDLPRTRDQEAFFGIADNGKVPQALMTTIVEVTTGLLWDWRIDRGRGSEKNHLLEMVPDLPAHTLLLGDGNFVGYPIWSALHKAGKSFVIRVGGNVHLLTGLWPDAEVEFDGDIVYAWPKKRRRAKPLMLRLVKVGRGRKAVYLLTNVLRSEELSRQEAGEIYRQRWGVELFFRTLKRTSGHAKLQCRTGRRARLELEWILISLMITTMLGMNAARRRRIRPERLSPSHVIKTIRKSMFREYPKPPPAQRTALMHKIVAKVKDTYQRHKPKHSRHRPQTKTTPRPLALKPPKLRRATAEERRKAQELKNRAA